MTRETDRGEPGGELTHVDRDGRAAMVDVGDKPPTTRRAVARARVRLGAEAFAAVRDDALKKGDALGVARVAGIQAAKDTARLIPLCHPVPLTRVAVELALDESRHSVVVTAEAVAVARTGVEMEALTAAGVAALTLYDMAKAVTKGIVVEELRLLSKSGGRSGDWKAD